MQIEQRRIGTPASTHSPRTPPTSFGVMRTTRGTLNGSGRSSLRTSIALSANASLGLSFLFKIQLVTWARKLAIT